MDSLSRSALYRVALGDSSPDEGLGESQGAFFLTLCAVSSPIPVPESKSAALQRYRFFFSRQHENGRERCWLHLGYFRTAEEARKWLEVLRRVYPAAAIRTIPQARAIQAAASEPGPLSDTQVLAQLKRSPDKVGSPE